MEEEAWGERRIPNPQSVQMMVMDWHSSYIEWHLGEFKEISQKKKNEKQNPLKKKERKKEFPDPPPKCAVW